MARTGKGRDGADAAPWQGQRGRICCLLFLPLLASTRAGRATESPALSRGAAPDARFLEELHEPLPIGEAPGSSDVRALAVDPQGDVWAATRAGVFVRPSGASGWSRPEGAPAAGEGSVFCVRAAEGAVWVGAWNGLHRLHEGKTLRVAGVEGPIAALCAAPRGVIAAGPDGWWMVSSGEAKRGQLPGSRGVRAVVADSSGAVWFGTGLGLDEVDGELVRHPLDLAAPWSTDVRGLALAADGAILAAGLGGVLVLRGDEVSPLEVGARGLPSIDARCVAAGPDGRIGIGTARGLVLGGPGGWALRHSRRWLLDDDVRDVVFGSDGAAWVATAKGVSVLRRRETTLARRAERFLDVCTARHVRPPGLVEKCRLPVPGDVSRWEPLDDDNDGQYTSMYLAMQSFRYAATKDPAARAAAAQAFAALRFLQTVTGTPSFVARTVIPSTWTRMADPNETISDEEWAERRVAEPRSKRVEEHWRHSADGQWLWKGDTSSDELTGHMYGYLFYHDLVADDAERSVVAAHVARIVDGIVAAGFVLNDIDGAPTRWGVWAPGRLNEDPDWEAERGINSVELLSYLKLTRHVTGDAKYDVIARKLLDEHGYRRNILRPRSLNPAWRTHIDDELLALAYPALLLHEEDPELLELYRASLEQWRRSIQDEGGALFDLTYALLTGKELDLEPTLCFLRDTPVDLVRWTVDNSWRRDLTVVRSPELEEEQTSILPPPSERGVLRWDDNPWRAVQGDGGRTESDGVYWLLPYWMARYLGLLR